ncbi:hypothetical protein ACFSHQ_12485 [Gemmobacter lanyuensis]
MAGLDGAQVTREDQGNVAVLLLAAPPRFQPGPRYGRIWLRRSGAPWRTRISRWC